MKCIKVGNDAPVRVPDDTARELVKAGKAVYCPKSDWKSAGRGK